MTNGTPGRRGPVWWVVVPLAVVVAVLGGLLDLRVNHAADVLFDVIFVLACVGL